MTQRDDGGPAFPRAGGLIGGPNMVEPQIGCSLRDLFALGAMVGMYAGGPMRADILLSTVAEAAYAQADAMLAERAKP